MANLSSDAKVVLKVDLGENGTRRIPLSKLWNESSVSYQRLVDFVLEICKCGDDATVVAVTYVDEDGDDITVSTDEELTEAFRQFVNKDPPVLRATAIVENKKEVKQSPSKTESENKIEESVLKLQKDITEIRNQAKTKEEKFAMAHVTNVMDSILAVVSQNLDALGKTMEQATGKNRQASANLPGKKQQSFAGKKKTAQPLRKSRAPMADKEKSSSEQTKKDVPFIHGRHTCDGCLVTPIIGIRYHATNIPDYDLCSKCLPQYKGKDIDFAPVELDRDRHLQQRWKRRKECRERSQRLATSRQERIARHRQSRMCGMAAPNMCAVERKDAELKEAIRRSLEESTPKEAAGKEVEITSKDAPEEKDEANQAEVTVPPSSESVEVIAPSVDEEEVVSKTPGNIEELEENKSEEANQELEEESTSKITGVDNIKLDAASDTKEEEIKSECETSNSRDFSFMDGAEDEVALALGAALDKCADAIDDLTDVSGNSLSKQSENAGDQILPGTEDDTASGSSDAASVKSEDDWQCVESGTDSDIAKAAYLLGSALFQSDIASPSGELEDSTISGISSVPTLSSEISSVLLTRWENELRQLHELGFLDDHVNVNALEHLEAANIGCSSTDDITVNAAVEHILQNKN